MSTLDAGMLGEGIASLVKAQVARATAPLIAELSELRAELAARPDAITHADIVARAAIAAITAIPKPADGKSVTLDDVRPMLEQLVANAVKAIPKPADGKSVTREEVEPLLRGLVDSAVSLIPRPADGKSVTIDDVRPLIEHAVAALPKAIDGKSVTVEEMRPLVHRLINERPKAKDGDPGKDAEPVDYDQVKGWIDSAVSSAIALLPPPKDGKNVDPEFVRQEISRAVDAIPKPKDGAAGKEGAPAVVDYERIANAVLAMLPRPKDGTNGTDGASVDPTIVAAMIAEQVRAMPNVHPDSVRLFIAEEVARAMQAASTVMREQVTVETRAAVAELPPPPVVPAAETAEEIWKGLAQSFKDSALAT